MGEEAEFWLTKKGNNEKFKFEKEYVWYIFWHNLCCILYPARKNGTLCNDANKIKQQERLGN